MFDHDKLKSMVVRAADMTLEAREMSERDRDYYDSYQWTAEEEAVLRRRKQPVLVKNRIKRKIDAMVGLEQKGRVDPAAYPRNPQDEDAADIATKALRYVEEVERIDMIRSDAFYNLLIEGYGGCEVIAEMGAEDVEVRVKRLRWEEIFYDPHSREKDFSDAAYMGVQKWMSEDAALSFAAQWWQGEPEELSAMLDTQSDDTGATYDDRPYEQNMAWVDRRLRRVRLAQMYYRYGNQWHFAVFTGRGELYNGPSPYRSKGGRPDNPMILMSAYVDRENRRYGVVRDMISAQDEINKRSSKLLHMLNTRQSISVKGALDSVAGMKRELAAPDGHVEVNVEAFEDAARVGMRPFEVVQNGDQVQGQALLLTEAKNEIDMTGPNASLLGQLQGDQSGRAIMAQQQAGLAELAPVYDSLRDWTERVYRAVWARIQQFWQAPRWIRVTDDEQAPQFVGVNQPVMTPQGPMMQNPVAQIDVDIIVSMSPEFVSLRHEQFERLVALAESGYPIPPQVIIEASDLRDKRKIMEAMQPDPQQAQIQQQMQMRGAMADIAGREADVGAKQAKAARDQAAAIRDMESINTEQAKVRISALDAATRAAMPARPAAGV